MATAINNDNLDAMVDAALEQARREPEPTLIVAAVYHPEPGMDFLEMKLSDGRRLLVPREELGELKNATAEQATDLRVFLSGTAVYWPQLDDGLQLADFLQYRWRRESEAVAAAA